MDSRLADRSQPKAMTAQAAQLREHPRIGGRAGLGAGGANARLELICLTILVSLAALVFFFGLGNFPLFNPDECFYAEPAREMLDTHDYITTTLNYAVRYTKPPLFMWIMSVCYQLFGQNEFAARFFSACSGTALVGITYSMLVRFCSLRAACLGACVLISGPLFVATGRMAIADMPLALFVAGSLFCFFRAYKEQTRGLIWLGYVLIAAAVMTKGPVGVALPVLVLAVWHFLRGDLLKGLKFYQPHFGALLVACLALPWFVVETIVTKGEYFNCFIIMENFQRFTRVVSGHKGHWYYHILAIAAGLLPWSVFLPQALMSAFIARKDSGALNRGSRQAGTDLFSKLIASCQVILERFRNLTVSQDFSLFCACAAVMIVLFFSMSTSKLLSYTLPAFPFIAAIIAIEIDKLCSDRRTPIGFILLATVYGAGAAVAPAVLQLIHRAPNFLGDIVRPYCAIQFAAMVIVFALLKFKRFAPALTVFCASTMVTFAVYGYSGLSAISKQWEGPVPDLARYAALSGEPLFVYKVRLPSVPFYTHKATVLSPALEKPIPGTNRYTGVAGEPEPPSIPWLGLKGVDDKARVPAVPVEDAIKSFDRAYVIARQADDQFFKATPGFKFVARDGQYVLVHWRKPGLSK